MICTNKINFLLCMIFCVIGYVFGVQYKTPVDDRNPEKWVNLAKDNIENLLKRKLNGNIAKNLIMFLGDGMGISTVTAGRIRKGQLKSHSGEEEVTYMEQLGNVALSKTYNIDAQTADSAGTATAYLCGVKTGHSIIGLDGRAIQKNCKSSNNTKVDSILKWAHKAGKLVGIVTTTRITHATPAGAYAHVPFRNWEGYNGKEFTEKEHNDGCKDIAVQLIEDNSYINVIFGGGRIKFLPTNEYDHVNKSTRGERIDKRNLINEWIEKMKSQNKTHKFIWNATDFRNTNMREYDHVLALLAADHMEYEIYRNSSEEPSIVEMTQKAIELLDKSENGYFLLVEGGRIDHGHHGSKAKRALDEFVAFDESIGKALNMTSTQDTLTVVTADHSHVFTIGGYATRGNDIYGINVNVFHGKNLSDSNLTYTSLLYGNGPGGILQIRNKNLTNEETTDNEYTQESGVFIKSETHGGEDVAIYASGPMSHLFEGTVEQNFIPHAMAYAACIGPLYGNNVNCFKERGYSLPPALSGANKIHSTLLYIVILKIIFKTLNILFTN